MSSDLWSNRTASWAYLNDRHPSRTSVVLRTFEMLDACVDEFEQYSKDSTYSRICGLTMLKAKNLAQGSLSLILDGLGQESGALLRPLIEYTELLTYFDRFPERAVQAAENDLPSAGQRAKEINGIYKGLRDHLNEHAAHSSYSYYSLSHLVRADMSFRKLQEFVPHVLDRNLRDFSVQLQLLMQQGVIALRHTPTLKLPQLAESADRLKSRMLSVFDLNAASQEAPRK